MKMVGQKVFKSFRNKFFFLLKFGTPYCKKREKYMNKTKTHLNKVNNSILYQYRYYNHTIIIVNIPHRHCSLLNPGIGRDVVTTLASF